MNSLQSTMGPLHLMCTDFLISTQQQKTKCPFRWQEGVIQLPPTSLCCIEVKVEVLYEIGVTVKNL